MVTRAPPALLTCTCRVGQSPHHPGARIGARGERGQAPPNRRRTVMAVPGFPVARWSGTWAFGSAVLAGVLLLSFAQPARPAFPGANGKIYFDANADVWSVDPDGSGAKRLTADYQGYDTDAAASADGTKVAWISERAGIHVWIMNFDGSGKKQVTNDTNDAYVQDGDTGPAWSPDGTKIAFASDRNPDKRSHILVVNLLTKAVTPLTTPVGSDG